MEFISATILSAAPLIIFVGADTMDISSSSMLAEPLRDRRVVFIILTQWSAESDHHADNLAAFVTKYQKRYKNHSYIIFCNTSGEVANLKRRGIKAYFGQQNAFVDPSLYKISRQDSPDLIAVYTAQLAKFKRHQLCAELNSVAFIYHNLNTSDIQNRESETLYQERLGYYRHLKATVPGARFMNEELAPPHGYLSPERVVEVLNRASVGLCLSEEEGGMHASVEYLLAGLPVVSTPSRGGRDFFFHEDFAEIADPNPAAVAAAVDRVLKRAPPAEEIRARTIALQQKQIGLFIDFLDTLVKAEGGTGYTRVDWDACYTDKLLGWADLETFLRRIPPAPPRTPTPGFLDRVTRFYRRR